MCIKRPLKSLMCLSHYLCPSRITLPSPVRAVPGLFWTIIVRLLMGHVQVVYEFCLSLWGSWSCNAYIISLRAPYGFRNYKQPVQALYGHIRNPCRIFANSGCVNSLMCAQGCHTAPLQVPHGPRTGPVRYENYWSFPLGACMMPAWTSHGVHVVSCELSDQTVSVQPCQAIWGP